MGKVSLKTTVPVEIRFTVNVVRWFALSIAADTEYLLFGEISKSFVGSTAAAGFT